jgi:hypothetical protein
LKWVVSCPKLVGGTFDNQRKVPAEFGSATYKELVATVGRARTGHADPKTARPPARAEKLGAITKDED